MSDDRAANEHHAAAIYAAQLIGFDLVSSYGELPVGFRINWEDANRAGWFSDCDKIGTFKRAYCAYIAGRLRVRRPTGRQSRPINPNPGGNHAAPLGRA